MKKVRVLILIAAVMMLFSSCKQKEVPEATSGSTIQASAVPEATSSSTIQASVPMEDQNKELTSLKQRVGELEAELQQRVGHLENYFDRRTPESVAKLYVDALKTRNGALLYALYSKELKAENYDFFVSIGWHLGVSNSPHIESFTLSKPIKSEDGQTKITIILHYTPRDGITLNDTCTLSLKQTQKEINDDWYITAFKYEP